MNDFIKGSPKTAVIIWMYATQRHGRMNSTHSDTFQRAWNEKQRKTRDGV